MAVWIPLVSVLIAFTAIAYALRRAPSGPTQWTALAWFSLFLGGFSADAHWIPFDFEVAKVLSAMFPALLLAGALEQAGQPRPRWLLPLATALAFLRGGAHLLGAPDLAPILSLALDVPMLVATGVVTWRSPWAQEEGLVRVLAATLALLAVPRGLDSLADLATGQRGVELIGVWSAVAVPAAVLQGGVGLLSARRSTRQAREALAESHRRFEALARGSHDLITEMDGSGRFVYASPSFEMVLGHPPTTLLGTPVAELIHPADRKHLTQTARQALSQEGSLALPLVRARHADGSWRWLDGTSRRYRTRRGEDRIVVVNRDVSERIHMEERLRSTQRLESLGLLAGGIAHDLNNLLVPVLGNASLLRQDLPRHSPFAEAVADLEEGALRAADLSRQLLAFAGSHRPELTAQDLSQLAAGVARLFEPTLPPGITLRTKLSEGLSPVLGDAAQLRQVLTSLLANGVEALEGSGGTLTLETTPVALDASDLLRLDGGSRMQPGSFVSLEVRDDGRGMDEEIRQRAFDAFSSTSLSGHGLGLAVVLGIVRAHGGEMEVHNAPGRGSSFRVLLPVAPASAAELRDTSQAEGSLGTVLVVDDEASVRRVAGRILKQRGFQVREARNGREAIHHLRRDTEGISAVLLDLVMPEIPGDEVFRELRELRPELPVVVSSGMGEGDAVARLAGDPHTRFLTKPYAAGALVEALGELLPTGDATPEQ